MVISDYSGFGYRNGGTMNAVEKAFQMITEGEDVLDAVIAGVNIPENDPTETGIGYGGLPNERGVVQLDACCMHGPKKRAGGVAALEGVRTPSLVAKAVADYTDHHLLVGQGAQDFARNIGFEIEADLNTDRSRNLWLEWRQRVDPEHYLFVALVAVGLTSARCQVVLADHWSGSVTLPGVATRPPSTWCAKALSLSTASGVRSTATVSTPPAKSAE